MSEPRSIKIVTVTNPQGLHARPANLFVKMASEFDAKIEVVKDGERVDGKSILLILTLGVEQGTEISIEATGRDASAATSALVDLVNAGFQE